MAQHDGDELTDWSVSLVVTTPPSEQDKDRTRLVDEVLDLLGIFDVADTVVSEDDGGGLSLSFTVTATAPNVAVHQGMDLWSKISVKVGIDSWPMVRVEASTYDALEKDFLATALPPLVGVAEVAELLGVSKQRVSALHQEDRLPRPIARLASGPVWAAAGIKKFSEGRAQQPYRAARAATAVAK